MSPDSSMSRREDFPVDADCATYGYAATGDDEPICSGGRRR
jgi:hypothetical protein